MQCNNRTAQVPAPALPTAEDAVHAFQQMGNGRPFHDASKIWK